MTVKLADPFELSGLCAAAIAASQTGLLEAFMEGPVAPADASARLGLDSRAAERVLEVLAAAGLLHKENGRFAAAPALARLHARAPGGVSELVSLWEQTLAFLRTGDPADTEVTPAGGIGALASIFEGAAAALAERLLGSGTRVLDIGAGSAVWSLAMAAREPEVEVTAFDLPEVTPAAVERAHQLGMGVRLRAVAGDWRRQLPSGVFDRVLLANVLHLETEGDAEKLVRAAAGALAPGGVMAVVDFVDAPGRTLGHAVYDLHLALRTRRGRAHPAERLEAWLRAAGLSVVARLDLGDSASGLAALVGQRPAGG
jgi:SAM-dependent methyltransferase